MKLFEDYTIYGPYFHPKEKRVYVQLVANNHRTTMSYARYLMCIKLGRILTDDEEVDHIDDNKRNDSIDNLQILTGTKNRNKTQLKSETFNCAFCGNAFTLEGRALSNSKTKRKMGQSGPYCSRSCVARASSSGVRTPSL